MHATRIVGFNPEQMRKQMFEIARDEQTKRLVEYAQQKVSEIAQKITSYGSRHHMVRKGNLLDSLCWGVCYDGKLVNSGFYRDKTATESSRLHEFFTITWMEPKYRKKNPTGNPYTDLQTSARKLNAGNLPPVDGHEIAERYLERYGNRGGEGWKVFIAILAPYWGYWEQGFKMKSKIGGGESFLQFNVMTQYYDEIKNDLKPAKVRLRVSVAKYNYIKLAKQAKRNFQRG